MYSGNGNGGFRPSYTPPSGGYVSIFGLRVKSVYLYIGVAAVVLLAVYMLLRFLNTSLVMHFSAYAGVLLLLANLRELLGSAYAQRNSTALLNCLIAGGLICAWLSQLLGAILWLPAVLLVLIATPLAFSRGTVYAGYITAARSAVSSARKLVVR
jgi:hypothetical protein